MSHVPCPIMVSYIFHSGCKINPSLQLNHFLFLIFFTFFTVQTVEPCFQNFKFTFSISPFLTPRRARRPWPAFMSLYFSLQLARVHAVQRVHAYSGGGVKFCCNVTLCTFLNLFWIQLQQRIFIGQKKTYYSVVACSMHCHASIRALDILVLEIDAREQILFEKV